MYTFRRKEYVVSPDDLAELFERRGYSARVVGYSDNGIVFGKEGQFIDLKWVGWHQFKQYPPEFFGAFIDYCIFNYEDYACQQEAKRAALPPVPKVTDSAEFWRKASQPVPNYMEQLAAQVRRPIMLDD